jgi:hypothetical protein
MFHLNITYHKDNINRLQLSQASSYTSAWNWIRQTISRLLAFLVQLGLDAVPNLCYHTSFVVTLAIRSKLDTVYPSLKVGQFCLRRTNEYDKMQA